MARIFVVEDDESIRTLLASYLDRTGFEVATATDGITALLEVGKVQPDLILLDMGLPRLNGWQATQRLRSRRETAHIPIIALTAYVMEEDRQRALNIGCNAFVAKPIDLDLLLSTINRLISPAGAL